MGQWKALTFSMISNDTLNGNMIKIGQIPSLEKNSMQIITKILNNNNVFASKSNCFSLYFASEEIVIKYWEK